MENTFKLAATEESPEIIFNKIDNEFKIFGRSMPEDAHEFYKPVLQWFDEYSNDPNPYTVLEIQLEYFNSGSVKQVFALLCVMENILESGKEAKVIWIYRQGDELMQMRGLEFDKFLDIEVEVIRR